jgi:CDP-4-dehydro-6-deoxyglucose reductase
MALEWQKGIVTKIVDETHSTKRYWIQIPEMNSFDFEPGQFVTLDLPIHEQKNKRWRSYSIASAPDGTNTFELVIVLNEFGLGTPYLFNHVNVGSELILRGPQGKFTMPEVLDKDLYLICTGTGIAPFRSMAHYIHSAKLPHQQVHIIFGCRKFEDGLYINELKALEKELTGFHFHPCYSREETVSEGQHKGYVHDVYEQLLNASKSADGTMPEAYFFLCGWKNMIDSAKEKIVSLGYDKKAIHLELYG